MRSELEKFLRAVRRQRCDEFVEEWGVCEAGHVLTPTNQDSRGRCWCCTRSFERAFAEDHHHAAER